MRIGGALLFLAACGGGGAAVANPPMKPPAPEDTEAIYAPLTVGADWKTYKQMNSSPVMSKTHGGRFVDTWVNEVGAAAYLADEGPIPVGTVVVKTSWEKGPDDQPSTVPGPIFVMEKKEPGYAPDHGDWYYAIHWENPVGEQAAKLGGPIYWRGKSHKVDYCWKCHDNYDRELGGVPPAQRIGNP
jgi:hypothetical protein